MCFKIIICVMAVVFGQEVLGQLWGLPRYPCNVFESISIEGGQEFPNKSILFEGTMYPPDLHFTYIVNEMSQEYKYNKEEYKEDHRRGCICLLKDCVRKCCPAHKYYVQRTCVDTDITFERNVTDPYGNVVENGFSKLGVVYGNSCPTGEMHLLHLWDDTVFSTILPNGSLYVPNAGDGIEPLFGHLRYCLEDANIFDEEVQPVVLVCAFEDEHMSGQSLRFVLLPICMLFSILFLAATFIMHVILPELRTLHGRCLMCCIAGLITAYTTLCATQLSVGNVPDTTCSILGFLIYYAFIFTFFWLNVTSFDIWASFSEYRFCSSRTNEDDSMKFTFYSIYACGGSLFLFAVTLGMHLHPHVHQRHKPGFGMGSCWLQEAAVFQYFYGPMLFLIILNIIFFIASSIKILNINRKMTMEEHQRFFLILKMFLIMGVTWIFEILSWWLGGSDWLWIITDIFNAMQGILIFMVYIFNPKVRQLLKRRFNTSVTPLATEVEFNRKNSETLDGAVDLTI